MSMKSINNYYITWQTLNDDKNNKTIFDNVNPYYCIKKKQVNQKIINIQYVTAENQNNIDNIII